MFKIYAIFALPSAVTPASEAAAMPMPERGASASIKVAAPQHAPARYASAPTFFDIA